MEETVDNPALLAEAHFHFNEPCIVGWEVCRLIGYAEDEYDCYWILRKPGTCMEDGKVFWHTCVGGVYWLDKLKEQGVVHTKYGNRWDDFYRIENSLQLNGCRKEEKFQLVIVPHGMETHTQTCDDCRTDNSENQV